MRAGAEPLGAAVLIRVHAFVAPVLRAAELGRDEIVWFVTLVALAVPLIALPLLDRLLRKP